MHISKIELENIKSHISSTFEFSRGTTAITGENGAGKTTIIEAIAWTLFDLLEYKKEDFVRRGAKKGSVRVTFESSLDEREYIVYRDSGAGYHVTDPRLNTRIADKKEEVFRFLWQHLGLEPGTDLKSLFRQAIGVPQGTFTAIFLEGSTERKSAFDRLLKVEEYRQAAEKLRDTSRFLDQSILVIRESIARAEGELSRSETVTAEHDKIKEHSHKLNGEIEKIAAELADKQSRVKLLNEQEKQLTDLRSTLERRRSDKEKLEIIVQQAEAALARATEAATKIDKTRSHHEQHLTALRKLTELERERKHRDQLKSELAKTDAAIVNVKAEHRRHEQELNNIAAARKEIETLRAKAAEQLEIETETEDVRNKIAGSRNAVERLESINREIENKRSIYRTHREDVKANASDTQQAVEDNESFKRLGMELQKDVDGLKIKQKALEVDAQQLGKYEQRYSELQSKLKALVDPAARIRVLEKSLIREPELRTGLTNVESNLERLESERKLFIEQLDDFKDFDKRWSQLTAERDATINAHRTFLANEGEASMLAGLKKELQVSNDKVAAAKTNLEKAQAAFASAAGGYDVERHKIERSELLNAERRLAETHATFAAAKTREEQIAAELERFAAIRKSLQTEFKDKERLETVAETTAFIRDTLKEAAPRVARNYVYHVSLEANQMFREITGNGERTLKWTEDYSIVLEEDGYERPFQSLSGGEQMSAALSVRLAILKQMSDIRIAFFDEPTTNMDTERRENFAEQISRIKHFDQLFVISHDDTFDNYVDNVLSIGD
ncbi:MAG: hypothetical protein IPL32_04135 [Chloracidobacterium sp.]|nr:hypothetical protein [Chloracidobacterium sp.]